MLVTTSDYVTGRVGTYDTRTGDVAMAAELAMDPDTIPDRAAGRSLLLERANGSVLVQDTTDPLRTVGTIDVDPAGAAGPYASNPVRVLATDEGGTKAYVVLSTGNEVSIVDLTAEGDAVPMGTIDLSALISEDDEDGWVDGTDALVIGDRLYVGLGRYWFDDAFEQHFAGSLLAVVDTTTDTLVDVDPVADGVQGIALEGNNPWRGMTYDATANRIYVGSAGGSFALDGGIEIIDVAAGASAGFLVTEEQLGGELNGFGFVDPATLAVLIGMELSMVDMTTDPPSVRVLRGSVDGMVLDGHCLFSASRGEEDEGLRVHDVRDDSDITPGGTAIRVGELPIYGMAPAL
jgi:hypothetical protein